MHNILYNPICACILLDGQIAEMHFFRVPWNSIVIDAHNAYPDKAVMCVTLIDFDRCILGSLYIRLATPNKISWETSLCTESDRRVPPFWCHVWSLWFLLPSLSVGEPVSPSEQPRSRISQVLQSNRQMNFTLTLRDFFWPFVAYALKALAIRLSYPHRPSERKSRDKLRETYFGSGGHIVLALVRYITQCPRLLAIRNALNTHECS